MGVIWVYENGWLRMMIHPLPHQQRRDALFFLTWANTTPIGPSWETKKTFPNDSISIKKKKQRGKKRESLTRRSSQFKERLFQKNVSPEGSKQAISALFGGDLCSQLRSYTADASLYWHSVAFFFLSLFSLFFFFLQKFIQQRRGLDYRRHTFLLCSCWYGSLACALGKWRPCRSESPVGGGVWSWRRAKIMVREFPWKWPHSLG